MLFQTYSLETYISISGSVNQDQTAHSVQSDLDLHCPQMVIKSCLSVRGLILDPTPKFWTCFMCSHSNTKIASTVSEQLQINLC